MKFNTSPKFLFTGTLLIIIVWFFMALFLAVLFGPESYCIVEPYIDTRMSENFNPKKFNTIKIGFTKKEVVELVGEPLGKSTKLINNQIIETYGYTNDGAISDLEEIPWYASTDHAWYDCFVRFNEEQEVIEVYRNWMYD